MEPYIMYAHKPCVHLDQHEDKDGITTARFDLSSAHGHRRAAHEGTTYCDLGGIASSDRMLPAMRIPRRVDDDIMTVPENRQLSAAP